MNRLWHIIGNGAIGSLVSYHLDKRNVPYQVIDRDSTTRTDIAFLDCQYNRQTSNGNKETNAFKIPLSALANTTLQASICNIVLPLKAFQIKDAFSSLKPLLSDEANIILLHNGMGCSDELVKQLGVKQSLYLASTTHGAFKPAKQMLNHTGLGSTYIGYAKGKRGISNHIETTNELPLPIQDFISALPPFDWDNNIQLRLWNKLAINCCINPLTALSQQKNSSVLNSEYKATLIEICKEVALCANTQGLSLDWQYLLELSLDVAEKTGENYSSMNRDVYFKRQTEIDYINGYICKVAAKHQIKTPTNQALVNKVRALS